MPPNQEPESKFVKAGKLNIHYHEFGKGYPLICIHGAGPGATGWSNFKGSVGDLSRHFRTLLIDMPQYGKSDKPVIKVSRQSFLANSIRDFMDGLGIKKAHFIGNSMGGQAALKLAIDYPEKVDRLVVIGSGAIKAGSIFQPMPLEAIRNIGNYYKGEGPTLGKMREVLESLVYDRSRITDDLVQERFEASNDPELIEIFGKQPAGPQDDLYADLPNLKAKTLIVWGQDDRAGALDVGLLMLRRLPDARMHIFSKCGHWAHVEHHDEFDRLVLQFFMADGA
ncbi:MAG TPA: alpha/beta hydrolase [Candidatus Binatia bacterium]|jgi:2-hydroxy-6-oxonona-2,4-dienedioate hydrolase/4,5:9,10-diseco-3-hydroxy-5,9,17-trioxoandrosta-1(10),2-diene-4-oate hydrolase|nr:alpha/beta hydrolase [Candidatus Binatia bacterium]